MVRSLASRLIAGILVLVVAFAVPGDALAHGEAHHREHESAHHAGPPVAQLAPALSAPDHDHAHGHSRLEGAGRTRVDAPAFVARPAAIVLVAEAILRAAAVPSPREVLTRGDPPTGPPPRLRGPPAR